MPTVYSLFGPKPQFLTSSGEPMTGGRLFFFTAGSTSPKATYTDSTGTVTNSNPVVLNSLGSPANGIWGTTGAYRIVCEDSLANVLWTVDGIVGINDSGVSVVSEWVASGLAPTFISSTSFSVLGDQTATFTQGRRVQTSNTGGVITSSVVSATFGAGSTTIVVANDSGVIDSGLTSVSFGLLNAAAPSVPFSGLRRIQGDFSNATLGSRSYVQTLTVNGLTSLGLLPNGSGGSSNFAAFNGPDPANASVAAVSVTASAALFQASRNGSGSFLPFRITTSDITRQEVTVGGDIGMGRTPLYNLDVYRSGTTNSTIVAGNDQVSAALQAVSNTQCNVGTISNHPAVIITNNTPRLHVRTDGSLWTDNNARPGFFSRAWVNFNGTGTPAIRAGGNFSSITDNGPGDYTVNLSTAMPDTSFAAIASCSDDGSGANIPGVVSIVSQTTGSVRLLVRDSGSGSVDRTTVTCAIFR